MARTKTRTTRISPQETPALRSLGIKTDSIVGTVEALETGLPFTSLLRFQKASRLPLPVVAGALQIPPRTLARRKAGGRLSPQESERLLRLARLFDRAVSLCEGDAVAARNWLRAPQPAFGDRTPLEFGESEIGGRAVEDLIGRLEYGVYS